MTVDDAPATDAPATECKSLCDHKLGPNIFLPGPLPFIQVTHNIPAGPAFVTARRRHVKQVKLPCSVGILVLICACVFVSMDWFASDEVHELVKQ